MKYGYKSLIVIIISTLIQPFSPAVAGGVGDGGGQGIVCRNDDGTVASAQLLDLAEAENFFLFNLKKQPKDRPYLEIAREYAAILDNAIPANMPTSTKTSTSGNAPAKISYDISVGVLLSKFLKNQRIKELVDLIDVTKSLIPGNSFKIPAVQDSNPKILPSAKNCSLEQIAVYRDGTNQVHFVGSVWNELNNVNKAALLIHESLYRVLREMNDTTSDRTRKMVAYLFGGLKFEWILDGLPLEYLFCWTTDAEASFRFAVYPISTDYVAAQFLVYNGEVMFNKTVTALHMLPFARQFGLGIPHRGDIPNTNILSNKIKNPLLDIPNYSFYVEENKPNAGAIVASIEASSLVSGQNPKQITCNPGLSLINYGPNKSVGIKSQW